MGRVFGFEFFGRGGGGVGLCGFEEIVGGGWGFMGIFIVFGSYGFEK